MNGIIYDTLYGKIPYTDLDLKIFASPEMARLRRVSLSTVPNWCSASGACCSRFEHSIGAWHLAKLVARKPEFANIAKDIEFAGLFHDAGSPPFSHGADHFQKKILGKKHDEIVADLIMGSALGKEIESQGGNPEVISKLISGTFPPFSDLINNSIDLDNLDNTLRFGLSMGIFKKRYYNPLRIADNFYLKSGELALRSSKNIREWENCREIVYDFINNKYPEGMIYRAMHLAYRAGDLTKDFFRLDDFQATAFLKKCNPGTKRIIERLESWDFDKVIFSQNFLSLDKIEPRMIDDPDYRFILADRISSEFKIPPEDISCLAGKNKGFKQIHLPIGREFHQPQTKPSWRLRIDVNKKWLYLKKEINHFVKQRLTNGN